jgi:hypothetical protein
MHDDAIDALVYLGLVVLDHQLAQEHHRISPLQRLWSIVQSKDKFIAFVDILGFSSLVKTEEESGRGLSRALELVTLLGSADRPHFSSVCPHSRRLATDIDFKMTPLVSG